MTQPAIEGSGGAPAGGNAQPGGPAPGGESGAAGDPPPASTWYDAASPEAKAWITEQQAQGIKSLDELALSHRGLLKLKGVPERELLRLPEKWEENPEVAAKVHARLGRPEKPDGYEIPAIPVGDGDVDLAPQFKEWAHEAGLSPRQAKALATKYQETLQGFSANREAQITAKLAEEDTALRAEWGGAYAENEKAATKAANLLSQSVGLDAPALDALFQSAFGYARGMKMLALLGRSLGEHQKVDGDADTSGMFGMTPQAAQRKARDLEGERMKLDRNDPRYRDLSDEITRMYHVATGEQIPEELRPRSRGA